MRNHAHIAITIILLAFIMTGCGSVTYPKETLSEAVIDLCKKEFDIDVDVSLVGNTLAIYLPLTSLLDVTLSLSEHAQDRIQDVLLGASRAVLSTDADVKFYCIIAQDVKLPEIQMVIIKYVDDIKRAFYHDISRGEYFKRTLIDINENPQSKKEQAIAGVFNKMHLDEDMQEKVLNDFFRSPPSSLEGVGYWNGKFYMKDITLQEFLAQQIASRVRMGFREKEGLKKYMLKSISGKFASEAEREAFVIEFDAGNMLFVFDPTEKDTMEREIFGSVFETAAEVIYGYKFENFDYLKAIEKNSDKKLFVSKEEVYLFRRKRLPMDVILGYIQ